MYKINTRTQENRPLVLSCQKTALIAMSGGVDSSVAAFLMKQTGFLCSGATMSLFAGGEKTAEEARIVADRLGIDFHIFDLAEHFTKHVIEPFINDYYKGCTPNPCVVCNKYLKFGKFLDKACELGIDHIVTGHYVKIEKDSNGRFLLKKGNDLLKDQSYVLYSLTQEQLSKVIFPLGDYTKTQVKEIAQNEGLINENKSESQDICFIPDGDYMGYINQYTGITPEKGRFVDVNGNFLGESKGISSYTIGQRRGLGLSMPHPPYVVEIRPEDNTVVVGKEEMLYSKSLSVKDINLIPYEKLDKPLKATVKIRYADPGHPATVRQTDDDMLYIEFDEPQRAITKGQAAVIYDGNYVIGGGIITDGNSMITVRS